METANTDSLGEKNHVEVLPISLTSIAQAPRPRASTLKKKRRGREERERKVARKGVKSMRGQPEAYNELKRIVTVSLTPTAVAGLDQCARDRSISRSELVERIGRQIIKLVNDLVHE